MILTTEYLNSHRTAKGAFTRKQVEALGIEWPPSRGWIKKAAGTEITEDQAKVFEEGKTYYNAGKGKATSKQLQSNVNFICKNIHHLTVDQIDQLIAAVYGESSVARKKREIQKIIESKRG